MLLLHGILYPASHGKLAQLTGNKTGSPSGNSHWNRSSVRPADPFEAGCESKWVLSSTQGYRLEITTETGSALVIKESSMDNFLCIIEVQYECILVILNIYSNISILLLVSNAMYQIVSTFVY